MGATNGRAFTVGDIESRIADVLGDCDDPWFTDQMTRYRAGEVAARNWISERCLPAVLDLAKRRCGRFASEDTVLEELQEGNATLVESIERFHGANAREFLALMVGAVEQRIDAYLRKH